MSGAEAYIGGTITIVMIREIAPGFVALAIGARAGTAISAEIANMQVTVWNKISGYFTGTLYCM